MAWFRRTNWGMPLLGIWLIIHGLIVLLPTLFLSISGAILTLLAVLAVAAGVLILLGR